MARSSCPVSSLYFMHIENNRISPRCSSLVISPFLILSSLRWLTDFLWLLRRISESFCIVPKYWKVYKHVLSFWLESLCVHPTGNQGRKAPAHPCWAHRTGYHCLCLRGQVPENITSRRHPWGKWLCTLWGILT